MSHQCVATCTAGWGPSRKSHCSSCGENFSTPTNFDTHRAGGEKGRWKQGECSPPQKRGLVQNQNGTWIKDGEGWRD